MRLCVAHPQAAAGVRLLAQKGASCRFSQQSIFVLSSLSYHITEGVALNDEEKVRCSGSGHTTAIGFCRTRADDLW